MSAVFRHFLVFFFLLFSMWATAEALPELKVAVLQSGTVNWELEHLKNNKLDEKHGVNLQVKKVASLSAARLALTSGSADMIVSDWLWAGKRNNDGDTLRFIPFSSQIGSIIIGPDSNLSTLKELKGKRIGVAGGPLNKGWVLLRAAALNSRVDLSSEAKIQFGAPPLLSQALKRGQIDLLVTFWHYGARLEAEGFHRWMTLENLMSSMGMDSKAPMLGYLFRDEYAQTNPDAVSGFMQAITETKTQLTQDDEAWMTLKPIMKAENEEIFQALVAGYRQGVPQPLNDEQKQDIQQFYQLIDQLSNDPKDQTLNLDLFYGQGR